MIALRKGIVRSRLFPRSCGLLAVLACAVLAEFRSTWAAPLNIPGQWIAGGPTVTIGSLSPNVTAAGVESATFTLNDPYRNLMSDLGNRQFRFFQVITYDDEPVTWMGKIITAAGTANHTGDVVDVPRGGWDYESTTGNKGGDDNSPFYESDTANNPATGKPYRFPGLSYPALHTADGTNPGTMSTNDSPGLSNANHSTLFETFIAYEDPNFLALKQVDILGGYTWGIQTDAGNNKSGIAPVNVAYADINKALIVELQGALNVSGFADWTVVSNDVILFSPEPSSLFLGIAGAFGVPVLVSLRRRTMRVAHEKCAIAAETT
jgi:hypothetical protein